MSPKYIAGPISSRSNARFIPHIGNRVPLGTVRTASTYLRMKRNKCINEKRNQKGSWFLKNVVSIITRHMRFKYTWCFSHEAWPAEWVHHSQGCSARGHEIQPCGHLHGDWKGIHGQSPHLPCMDRSSMSLWTIEDALLSSIICLKILTTLFLPYKLNSPIELSWEFHTHHLSWRNCEIRLSLQWYTWNPRW